MATSERERARRSLSALEAHLAKCKALEQNFRAQYTLAKQYFLDAKHYFLKGDYFTSFGCSDYAYGLLDAMLLAGESQRFPEPVVGALIFNGKNQIFLMRSHKWRGRYTIPGGHIELGESAEQALIREVKEETNLDISKIRHVITHELIYDPAFWKRRHFVMLDYACIAMNPEKVRLSDEAQGFVWRDFRKALKLRNIEPYALKALEALNAQKTKRHAYIQDVA